MGKHQTDLDERARVALADARRRAVLEPQVQRAQWRPRSDPKWAETIAAFSARCENGDPGSFWEWPETKALTHLLEDRAS